MCVFRNSGESFREESLFFCDEINFVFAWIVHCKTESIQRLVVTS